MRGMERDQLNALSTARYHPAVEVKQELDTTISAVVNAARQQPQLFGNTAVQPPAIDPVPPAITDRHNALLENPDRPQAVFVEQFHVHPRTVRRIRHELEQAGEIPVLAHRHGPTGQRVQLAEAAD